MENGKAVFNMTGEINNFRKRFFGGFNRQDVVDYVAKLAQERNELSKARDKAIRDAKELAAEVASLRIELDEAKKAVGEYKNKAIEAASRTFSELESAFESLHDEVESASAGARAKLEEVHGAIASAPSVLITAKSKLAELREMIETEKNALYYDIEHVDEDAEETEPDM